MLELALRWLHILSATMLVGGILFLAFVWLPAHQALTPEEREESFVPMRPTWSLMVTLTTLFLLVSGFWNFIIIYGKFDLPAAYTTLIAIKFLVALALFFLSAMIAGSSQGAVRLRHRLPIWLRLNALLAVLLIGIAGYMKIMDHSPKPKAETPIASILDHRFLSATMDKKTKKKIETIRQRKQKLQQRLAGARQQDDEPGEVERLEREIAECDEQVKKLQNP